jgi:hypothetical protein
MMHYAKRRCCCAPSCGRLKVTADLLDRRTFVAETPKTPTENVQEVFDLVKAYAVQETATPLKGVGRYLKFGLPGDISLGIGFIFLALAALRGLQEVDDFNGGSDGIGWFVWAPYAIVFAGSALILGFLASRITKGLGE